MKRQIKWVVSALVLVGAWSVWAGTKTVGGRTWTYDVSNGKATVTEVSPASGEITIPSSLGGYTVTSIGYGAFLSCSGLTSVTIPSSVTSIGGWAFANCSGLTSMTIPSSVRGIGSGAFNNCSGLKSVTIPPSVTSIGSDAFAFCRELTSVTMPACVTKLSVTFPDAYNKITEVVVCDGVTSIGDAAFRYCSGLTSVAIPSSVTSIGRGAFNDCGGLMSFVVDSANLNYSSPNGLLCSKDGKTLIAGINGIVTIPASVTSIGSYAFSGLSGLTSVVIPEGVTNIGEQAFQACQKLKMVTIPSSVTNIAYEAFSGCSGLTSVTIIEGVTSIAGSVFYGCRGLTTVTIPSSVTSIGSYAFYDCSGLTSVTLPLLMTCISNYAFAYCSGLTSVMIPEGVTRIDGCAFRGCSGLASVTMPSSVTSVEADAFASCSGLVRVDIADLAKWCDISFGSSYANPLCYAGHLYLKGKEVEDLVIPEGVTNIGSLVFYGCSGLKSVMIPPSVTSIGSSAFSGCSGIKLVICAQGDVSRVKNMLRVSGVSIGNLIFKERPPMPIFTPSSGTIFNESLKISITCAVENATIHYTMDRTEPTAESPVFKKFMLSEKAEIKAIAEYDGCVSEVATAVYAKGWCVPPVISSSDQEFHFSGKDVIITCASEGAEIRYTTDGSDPTAQSRLYEGPFTIDDTTAVRAIAVGHPDYFDSEIATATFTREWLTVDSPTCNPPDGTTFY